METKQSANREEQARQSLITRVRADWVEGILAHSLYSASCLDQDFSSGLWRLTLEQPSQAPQPILPSPTFLNIFQRTQNAMLILSEPEMGKTTLLSLLTRDLLDEAEFDPRQPVPVVFNLSAWSQNNQSLVGWLTEQLSHNYKVNKKYGRKWLQEERFHLLLDGLDEVALPHRDACVHVINQFRQQHGHTHVVICSRLVEYEQLTTPLQLFNIVRLHPLTSDQIEAYLTAAGERVTAVQTAINHNTSLREMAQSPPLLSLITLAYRGRPPAEFTANNVTDHLSAVYVEHMFEPSVNEQTYAPNEAKQWLTWLAQQIKKHDQKIFYPEHLQPNWLAQDQEHNYQARIRRIIGLLFGTSTALLGGMFFYVTSLAISTLLLPLVEKRILFNWSLLVTAIGGIFVALGSISLWHYLRGRQLAKYRITIPDKSGWSWASAKRGLLHAIEASFIGGWFIAVVITFFPLVNMKSLQSLAPMTDKLDEGLIFALIFGLLMALISGIKNILRDLLIGGLIGYLSISQFFIDGFPNLVQDDSLNIPFFLFFITFDRFIRWSSPLPPRVKKRSGWLGFFNTSFVEELIRGLLMGLVYGLVSGQILEGASLGLVLGLTYGFIKSIYDLLNRQTAFDQTETLPGKQFDWSWPTIRRGILLGLILGFMIGQDNYFAAFAWDMGNIVAGYLILFLAVPCIILGGFSYEPIALTEGPYTAVRPNRPIRRLSQYAIRSGLITGAIIGGLPLGYLPVSVSWSWGSAILFFFIGMFIIGIGTTLGMGGETVLRHYVLRWLLYRQGKTPWRLEKFLNDMRDAKILYRIDGGYKFAHGILLNYFANISHTSR